MLFAGPLVAANLGDLGADVIKIESPKADEVRKTGGIKDGEGLWWRITSRNKRLISVDIAKPEGAAIARRLIATADVLVENFRVGRMAEWGLSYDVLSAENPGLVMLHISGYGQTGPYSNRPGMGTLAEAFSGFAHATGEADGPPTLPAYPLADGVASLVGTYAVLAALWGRERNGGIGDEIDLSLYEPLLSMMGPMLIEYDQLGRIAKRKGNRAIWTAPRNTYRAKDGRWVAVSSAANSAAMRLFRAIGRDDMANDPGFATNAQRVQRLEECDGAVADWVAARSLDEVMERFQEFGAVAGPVYDVEQIFEDPHVRHRETIVETHDERLGPIRMQGVIPKLKRQPGQVRWAGRPTVGEDTEAVLGELGIDAQELARLQREGVIRGIDRKAP
jgi:formyl-CoA transferase